MTGARKLVETLANSWFLASIWTCADNAGSGSLVFSIALYCGPGRLLVPARLTIASLKPASRIRRSFSRVTVSPMNSVLTWVTVRMFWPR